MKIGIQLFVTARKAITIESGEHATTSECMGDLRLAATALNLDVVKADIAALYGDD